MRDGGGDAGKGGRGEKRGEAREGGMERCREEGTDDGEGKEGRAEGQERERETEGQG